MYKIMPFKSPYLIHIIRFGAGSEFGREARQEARKRRYGGNKKVSESSPWTLKVGGKKYVLFFIIINMIIHNWLL